MPTEPTPSNTNCPLPLTRQEAENMLADMLTQNCLWFRIECCGCDDAAKKLDCKTDTVRELIKRGALPASKVGNDWKIRLIDIEAMLNKTANVVNMPAVYKARKKYSQL